MYSPVAFGKKTDPDGAYIRHWLPQLVRTTFFTSFFLSLPACLLCPRSDYFPFGQAKYPAKYIYSPWEASAEQQRQWGCVLGEHYPHRIVEHGSASKECMSRIQQAYADDKARRGREGGEEGGDDDEGENEEEEAGGKRSRSGSSKVDSKGKKRKQPNSAEETASAAQQTLISSFFKK